MGNVLFTIIVPVYNVEPYLDECLNSVLHQTFCNFEVIIIDDGSTDASGMICDDYANRDSRFRVIHQSNKGLSEARNAGIRHANGEYLLFVDSDDVIELDSLEIFAKVVLNQDVDIVTGLAYQWNEDGSLSQYSRNVHTPNVTIDGACYFEKAIKNNTLSVPAQFNLYSRTFIERNSLSFMPNIKHEDTLWTPKAFYLAASVVCSGFTFYHYRMRAGSITHSDNKTAKLRAKDILFVCQELHNFSSDIPKTKTKYLNDFIAMLYMSGTFIGRLDRENSFKINRFFPIRHAQSLHQVIKGLIFAFSPMLYCEINQFAKSRNKGE